MKLYTVKAVAAWLDLSEARVRQLRKEKIITEYKPGLYDLKTVTHDYINYLRKGSAAEASVDYNTERKEELHETEEVRQVMTDTLIKFKARLMAIPAKLSPLLSKKKDQTEIFKLLKAAIDEALEELADFQKLFGYKVDEEKDG